MSGGGDFSERFRFELLEYHFLKDFSGGRRDCDDSDVSFLRKG